MKCMCVYLTKESDQTVEVQIEKCFTKLQVLLGFVMKNSNMDPYVSPSYQAKARYLVTQNTSACKPLFNNSEMGYQY